MSATKALMTNFKLTEDVTAAAVEAIKSGMDKAEIVAVLQRLAEMIENSDD
jgi:hypothetical protein